MQVSWNDLTEDQKNEIALIAGFSEKDAWDLATRSSWEAIPEKKQDKLYLIDWHYYLHGAEAQ
jgi:hypothetical protein